MPKIKSAKKALRQNLRRRVVNSAKKHSLEKVVKQYQKLLASGNIEEAKKQLRLVYQKLDKSAKAKIIKKNTASRLKSRLTKKLK